MKFIEVEVRTSSIVHGFDQHNREVVEEVGDQEYVTKLVAVARIQSISEQFLLVTSSHGRVMYWEYKGTLQEIKARLDAAGLMIA